MTLVFFTFTRFEIPNIKMIKISYFKKVCKGKYALNYFSDRLIVEIFSRIEGQETGRLMVFHLQIEGHHETYLKWSKYEIYLIWFGLDDI